MHKYQTSILLVEADRDARLRHETALRAAGFSVLAIPTWNADRVLSAAVIVTDVPSFDVLQQCAPIAERPPAMVVIADTAKLALAPVSAGRKTGPRLMGIARTSSRPWSTRSTHRRFLTG